MLTYDSIAEVNFSELEFSLQHFCNGRWNIPQFKAKPLARGPGRLQHPDSAPVYVMAVYPLLTSWPKCQVLTLHCFFVIQFHFIFPPLLFHKRHRRKRPCTVFDLGARTRSSMSNTIIFLIGKFITAMEAVKFHFLFNYFHSFTSFIPSLILQCREWQDYYNCTFF